MRYKLEPAIVELIESHPSRDVTAINREIKEQFGRFIPVGVIQSVLMSTQRRAQLNSARDKAADKLSERVDRVAQIEDELYLLFHETDDLRGKLDVARELRQWIKQGTDLAGIEDKEQGVLFVLDPDWDTLPNA